MQVDIHKKKNLFINKNSPPQKLLNTISHADKLVFQSKIHKETK